MSTINHTRIARANWAIARECEHNHNHSHYQADDGGAGGWRPYMRRARAERPDRYTSRANICPTCHMTRALKTGTCGCDE